MSYSQDAGEISGDTPLASALWAIATRLELSQRLGTNESTVYRWLKRYQQKGIEALLQVKTPPGKQSLVPPTVMNQLHQKLTQPEGFNTYSQIQEWLSQECYDLALSVCVARPSALALRLRSAPLRG